MGHLLTICYVKSNDLDHLFDLRIAKNAICSAYFGNFGLGNRYCFTMPALE